MSSFDVATIFILFGTLCWFFIQYLRRKTEKNGRKLPPGPRGLPIIGNLHMLGRLPHRALRDLAKRYGPIMYLRLGRVPTIVISSPQAAELFLKTHNAVFSGRPPIEVAKYLSYDFRGMAFAPYGSYWRNVRKLCTIELLSTSKIDNMAGMRKEELELLVLSFRQAAAAGQPVDVTEKVEELIENTIYKMLFGYSTKNAGVSLKTFVKEIVELAGAFNLADYVPFLGKLDLQGFTRRTKAVAVGLDQVLEAIIEEHEREARDGVQKTHRDFVDVMLSLKNKSSNSETHDELSYSIDRTNIKAIIVDMIVGGIDTSHTSIEWAMSELIKNPRVMKQLQEEINSVVGVDRRVEEKDLSKLEYLDMVIKETYRLHPVAPLLVPREALEDVVIEGYYIPKKSQVSVNAWALGHDPDVWSENVEEFLPERFINSSTEYRGRDFQLIPFGYGRRGCPGMHLGLINTKLVVAQLVHCFNWELPGGVPPEELDMTESFGLTTPRAKHLVIVPTCRQLF